MRAHPSRVGCRVSCVAVAPNVRRSPAVQDFAIKGFEIALQACDGNLESFVATALALVKARSVPNVHPSPSSRYALRCASDVLHFPAGQATLSLEAFWPQRYEGSPRT
jgi:hypothetical protein